MGRKLTSWERADRESERASLRRKRAREVSARREKARKEKTKKLENNVKAAEKEVQKYEAFTGSLTNLHLHSHGDKFESNFLKPEKFTTNLKKPKIPQFKEKTFSFTEESKLKSAKKASKFNFEQYCKNENRSSFFLFVFLMGTKEDYEKFKTKKIAEIENLNTKKEKDLEKHNKSEEDRFSVHEKNLEKHKKELDKFLSDIKVEKDNFSKEENNRIKWYEDVKNGDVNHMEIAFEFIFPIEYTLDSSYEMLNPTDVTVGYEVKNKKDISICVNFPEELNFLPDKGLKMTPSGRGISEYKISQKIRTEVANKVFCSIAFGYFKTVFSIMESVDKINIEVGINGTDPKTGGAADLIFLLINVSREDFNNINLNKIDVLHAIENFEHKYRSTNTSKNIVGEIDRDNLIWATDDDSHIKVSKHLRNSFRSSFYK